MDVSGIGSMASSLSDIQDGNSLQVAVLKKAMNSQEQSAMQLLQGLPDSGQTTSSTNLPAHLGQNVNTTA
ncbi:YjfB family protein [Azospira inquinata]|uniref:YjfB family protein n=1 Tax=Azospira inquinata TaxID=2785627 RepID=A0A975SK00_9RHOO|nr:YjfB family protein [Azospira inquinata]QWT46954.1 YjfB family protein [Azospira inquinata]QWT47722.1 YjfB family protein [Azospira inquinata]